MKNKKNPFIITFIKKINPEDKKEVINSFLSNVKGSLYKKVYTDKKSKIIVTGDFISFHPLKNIPWNMWTGFSKRAELYFDDQHNAIYKIDIKYAFLSVLLTLIIFFLLILLFIIKTGYYSFILFLAFPISIYLFTISLRIFMHKRLFTQSLKLKKRGLGDYNWSEILKNKSDTELNTIASGNSSFPIEVEKLAIKERENRNKT